MQDQFSRTRMIFKRSGIEKLQQSKVAVFGLGGVGGYVVEVLARSGVGHIFLSSMMMWFASQILTDKYLLYIQLWAKTRLILP